MPWIEADRSLCTGHANCIAAADDVFDIDDHGLVVVPLAAVDLSDLERVRGAVSSCPVGALRLVG